ncbi:hypothetical protein Y1Q_0019640 [Alligator mississippiensis]|uniref:Uncharacterized protein n=1 Tax=Alligator mississippiensis TaxID=8496 RepID=A0A151PEV7_ALLMI|nr:hypothetical protein Y1Q_0019640 [Alligator mississippiensis]
MPLASITTCAEQHMSDSFQGYLECNPEDVYVVYTFRNLSIEGTLSFAQPGNLILGLGFFNPLIHLNPE